MLLLGLLFNYLFGSTAEKLGIPTWTILVATFGLIWYFRRRQAKKKLNGLKELPGPTGLPIIGNVLQLGGFPNKQLTKWAKQYGDIFQVKLGSFNTIVVSDPKMAKEIFSNDPALTGRLHAPHLDMHEDIPGLGVFGSEGERWEVHRRFLLRQLRDFGFGKSSMEALILEELNEVIEMYRKKAGKPVGEIRETLRLAVVNSLWTIMSSQRFEHDDPKLLKLTNNTSKKFNEVIEKGGLLLFIPWVRHIMPEASGYKSIREVIDQNREIFEEAVDDHKKNFNEGELRDFIDVYLAEMKKAENDPKSTFHGEIAERHLAAILFDLFFAGSDTTAMTTAWATLFLCTWPHVQKKLQQEMDEVTGENSRRVSVNDRPNMPYAVALVDEILRYSSIVPDGVPHRAMADREFRGYHIPKDSLVQPNMKYIHFNPNIWGDPDKFRPERFLTADGTKYVKSENLIPFQVGRRQCLGEALARDSIFLYVTNLFQQFSIKFDPAMGREPTLEPEIGFLLAPQPYTVIMTDRLNKKL